MSSVMSSFPGACYLSSPNTGPTSEPGTQETAYINRVLLTPALT